MMPILKSTWLVQRLQKPYPGCENNPFNFGGGLARGGIDKDAYALLNKIFQFDYMGSAEFEFGAVPRSLQAIIDGFRKAEGVHGEMKIGGVLIYYLCHTSVEKEVQARIRELAARQCRTKERVELDAAIKIRHPERIPKDELRWYESAKDFVGWLELDNNFMFFIDKPTFDKFLSAITPDPVDPKTAE